MTAELAAKLSSPENLPEVLVVGSQIRGAASEGASPVIAFDREAIDRTGVASLQQFFEKLPQNFGGGANGANVANLGLDRDTGNNFGQGSSINLRGLGTGTTLTLINGHRVPSSNRYQYVDVSLIPLSVVERVEILTDGASAIYGSDAVGGVVNIVLRQDFTGHETGLRYGTVTEGNLQEYQASQAAGWSWQGGRALVGYEYLKQENLAATEKDFSGDVAYTPYDLFPASRRHSVIVDGSQQLSDALTLDVSGSFARRDMDTAIASPWDVTQLFPRTQQWDLFAGLKLDLPRQWQARLSAGYGNSDVRYERTTVERGLSNTAPPTDMDSGIGYLDVIADGELIALPAGSLRGAFGASYRRDSYDFFDYRQLEQPFNPTRKVHSAFGELSIPLLRDRPGAHGLHLSVAARHDHYSDFGSTTNPKFGLLWEATAGLSFRATYGRSYRAPVFQDMQPNNTAVVLAAPNPSAPGGRTIAMEIANGNRDLGPERAKTWTAGVSFTPQSMSSLTVKGSYYHIDYADRIDSGHPSGITGLFSESTAPYLALLSFDPTVAQIEQARQLGLSGLGLYVLRGGPFGLAANQTEYDAEVILDNRYRNNASTRQRGIDFDISYGLEARGNQIALSLAGQHIIESTRRVTRDAVEADALNEVYRPVDLRMRGGAALTRQSLTGSLFVNYVDSYRDSSNAADPTVSSWVTVDLNLTYAFASASGRLRGTSLALNLQNLFDEDPPFVVNRINTGFDPTNATPLGRFVSATLTQRW